MKFLVLSTAFVAAFAFAPSAFGRPKMQIKAAVETTADFGYPKEFERAVECASQFGLCDVDELNDLAEKIEGFEGCFFEKGVEACEKEAADRVDVAEILKMQAELRLRLDYLQNANLFAIDVKDTHDRIDREELMKAMEALGTD